MIFFTFRSVPRDPLEQNFLVIQNNHQFYLVPMQSPYEYFKEGNESETVQLPRLSPEMKMEVAESTEKPENMYEDKENELVSTSTESASECEEDLSFKRDCNLKEHVIIHDDAYPYECSICDQSLKTEQSFKFHMSLHEGGKELFHCANCDFKSREATSVERHQIRWHANNMYRFKCHLCAKLFNNKTMFLKHMEIHTIAVCNVCNEVYENDHLTQHKCKYQNGQNDKNYNRGQCEEKCQVDVEKHHMSDERKYKLEKTEYSDESFNELNSGLNLFKEQVYFNCPQCKWRFRTIKLLKKHLKRHSQSFKCDDCDAVFKYRACFVKHKYKHNIKC